MTIESKLHWLLCGTICGLTIALVIVLLKRYVG
jgi:hypothetical protein